MPKRLIFNGFSMNAVSHVFHGLWRRPDSKQTGPIFVGVEGSEPGLRVPDVGDIDLVLFRLLGEAANAASVRQIEDYTLGAADGLLLKLVGLLLGIRGPSSLSAAVGYLLVPLIDHIAA